MSPARSAVILVLVAAHIGIVFGRQQTQTPPAGPRTDSLAVLLDEGQAVYGVDCSECHAEGGIGPVLAGNTRLANSDRVVTAILAGVSDGDMPAFALNLTDRQVAAVSTFIRNSWDNAYGIVLEADVKRLRAAAKGK